MQIILYSTDGCHLCEQAIGMFYYAKQQDLISYNGDLVIKDIIDDPDLVNLYGESIPVFSRSDSGEKLFWPIELDELVTWLNS